LLYGPGQFFCEHIAPIDCASTCLAYDAIFKTELATMDTLPDPATLTDRELIDEWCWISADAENREERSAAFAAELTKRHIDF
jgi:hypothetical protein